MNWYLNLEWQTSQPFDDNGLDDLMDRLADFAPALATSGRTIRTAIVLSAANPEDAISSGLRLVRAALSAYDVDFALTRVDAAADEAMATHLSANSIPRLAGIAEIASHLGVSRQRASKLAKSDAFPRAVMRLASGPVWLEGSVLNFASNWRRRPGRPPA